VYSHCLSLGCQDIPSGRKKGLCCLRFVNHQRVFLFHHITFSLPLISHKTLSSLIGQDLCILQGLRSPPISSEALLQTHYFLNKPNCCHRTFDTSGPPLSTLAHASLLVCYTNVPHFARGRDKISDSHTKRLAIQISALLKLIHKHPAFIDPFGKLCQRSYLGP
jgi:hypothetical protein